MQFLYNINSIALIIVFVFSRQNLNIQTFLSISYIKFLLSIFFFFYFFFYFFRQNLNIQAFVSVSYIKFLLFIAFSSLFFSNIFLSKNVNDIIVQFFFQTKSKYSFLCTTYMKLLFIYQLHKAPFYPSVT